MIRSFIIAFSMYSKIPMPHTRWDEKGMKYSLCFFPLVGAVIGAALILWRGICSFFEINELCFCAVSALIPLFVSGGIHLDGFIDTQDALSSYKDREEKLKILKDPHVGAFGVISCAAVLVLWAGLFSTVNSVKEMLLLSTGFVLSRALSALTLTCFKCASHSGLLYTFSNAAHKRAVRIASAAYIVLCMALVFDISVKAAVLIILACSASVFYYRYKSYKEFGGITGDLAGYFVVICETAVLAVSIFF